MNKIHNSQFTIHLRELVSDESRDESSCYLAEELLDALVRVVDDANCGRPQSLQIRHQKRFLFLS